MASLFSELEGIFFHAVVYVNPGKQWHWKYFMPFACPVLDSALLCYAFGFHEQLCTIINVG